MKARVTIKYELDWPEGLTQAQLRDREEKAWMSGERALLDLPSAVVKFELVGDRGRPKGSAARQSR